MYLLMEDDLTTEAEQEFEVSSNERVNIKSVSFWLYLNSVASGTNIKFTLSDSADAVLHTETIGIAAIKTQILATSNYSHGKYMWTPSSSLRLGVGTYKFKLQQMNNYSVSTFIGWCKEWETQFNPQATPVTNDVESAFYFRMYTYKDV